MAKNQRKTSEKESVSELVVPLTPIEGERHLLAELIEGDEPPIIKAVGFGPLAPGNNWVSYKLVTQGNRVLSIQVTEPDARQVAEDSAKIDFVTEFMDKNL